MYLRNWCAAVLLLSATGVCAAEAAIKPTTTLAAQTASNTSAANSFVGQTNGNAGAGNVSKVDIHSLLYPGATTKVYAHLVLWFGGSSHISIGYNSTDAAQIHSQITDMISRGIDGVVVVWYGPDSSIDKATKLVMAEAETHPGFTFAIMIDQGAIKWDSCSGCSPQQALISHLQYIERTYFPSPAYLTMQGKPVVTNFDIDQYYSVNWDEVAAALSTQPSFLFQNNGGFSHALSEGSYSWVMPTTSDYGMSYLTSFYDTGIPLKNELTAGAAYKGFNDSLASWGSNRVMGQQCGQTWLKTFSEINSLYNSGKQLPTLQLVTWNDYEEATEIESGINGCVSVSASVSDNSLRWTITGDETTVDHYIAYISSDGQNLMSLGETYPGTNSVDLCSYSIPNDSYTLYVQAVGKPSITNQISPAVKAALTCGGTTGGSTGLTLGATPSAMTIASGGSGTLTVSVAPQSGSFNSAVALTCSGLPSNLKCSFAPGSVTPGAGTASSILTVTAASASSAMIRRNGQGLFFATWLLGFGLCGIVFTGKIYGGRILRVVAASVVLTVIIGTISCGRNTVNSSPGSGSQNSHVVTINGSASSVQLSTTVTVTVN